MRSAPERRRASSFGVMILTTGGRLLPGSRVAIAPAFRATPRTAVSRWAPRGGARGSGLAGPPSATDGSGAGVLDDGAQRATGSAAGRAALGRAAIPRLPHEERRPGTLSAGVGCAGRDQSAAGLADVAAGGALMASLHSHRLQRSTSSSEMRSAGHDKAASRVALTPSGRAPRAARRADICLSPALRRIPHRRCEAVSRRAGAAAVGRDETGQNAHPARIQTMHFRRRRPTDTEGPSGRLCTRAVRHAACSSVGPACHRGPDGHRGAWKEDGWLARSI